MDAALEELVRRRARFRCEYCLLPEALVTTPFQFDHIIAQSHGGETTEGNLAFACFHCNNFKGPNLAGIDPESGDVVRLFHPRRDNCVEHFAWDRERMVGFRAVVRSCSSRRRRECFALVISFVFASKETPCLNGSL